MDIMTDADNQSSENSMKQPVKKTLSVWLATGLGIGLVSPAPGTVGGLWGIPLTLAIAHLPGLVFQILAVAVLGIFGVFLCTRAAADMGGKKDPGAIVWDEIASIPIVFLGVPMQRLATMPLAETWLLLLIGFSLHRLFDITKPPPIHHLEKLPDGLGIMADDWLAALFGCALFHIGLAMFNF